MLAMMVIRFITRCFIVDSIDTAHHLMGPDRYHYQSDGWLSESSAEVYEHSTETLFFGRQVGVQ